MAWFAAFDPATGTVGRHATQAVVHEGSVYVAAGSRTRGRRPGVHGLHRANEVVVHERLL